MTKAIVQGLCLGAGGFRYMRGQIAECLQNQQQTLKTCSTVRKHIFKGSTGVVESPTTRTSKFQSAGKDL